MSGMQSFFVIFGIVIIFAILFDIFASVLVPRPVRSAFLVSAYLRRYTWSLWRTLFIDVAPPQRRELLLGIFAPLVMVLLLACWVFGLILGFGFIFLGLQEGLRPMPTDLGAAMYYAGTSLLTIGYGDILAIQGPARFFSIAAAVGGLATVAVVLTFLFSLFASFQRRETFVVMLDGRASAPPSGVGLLETHATLDLVHDLPHLFESAQIWCAEVLDTHLAYPVLCYFRSSHVDVSWFAALGALLDAATLVMSTVEDVPKGHAALLHSVGSHLTHDLAKYFALLGDDEVLVDRAEFVQARQRLGAAGYRLVDEEQSWNAFRRLRAEYAADLNNMARHWLITPAPWIGDRSPLSAKHA